MDDTHMGLIQTAINRIGIPDHARDEAVSEGLYVIALALRSHNPERATFATYALYKLDKMLKGLAAREFKREQAEREYARLNSHKRYNHDAAASLEAVLDACDAVLTARERIILLGTAYGLHTSEISAATKTNGRQIKDILARARVAIAEYAEINEKPSRMPSKQRDPFAHRTIHAMEQTLFSGSELEEIVQCTNDIARLEKGLDVHSHHKV